jgi:hypothetical protein
MIKSNVLASSLIAFAGIAPKQANAMTPPTDQPVLDIKLQAIVGDSGEQKGIFSQTSPEIGNELLANPLSPLQGDDLFFTYMVPGSRFAAHDGSWWEIEDYDFEGAVGIRNVWYPRQRGVVSVQDVRRSIAQWVHPIQQTVPPIPKGVDYGVLDVRVQD